MLLLFQLATDVISAVQVVAMMASEIVKAHDIVEKQRDDALGIIRNSFRLIASICSGYFLLFAGFRM